MREIQVTPTDMTAISTILAVAPAGRKAAYLRFRSLMSRAARYLVEELLDLDTEVK